MFQTRWPALRRAIAVAGLACLCGAVHGEVLRYPGVENALDRRGDYPLKLLQLALKKAGSVDTVVRTTLYMQQNRSALEIARASGNLDIMAAATSKEREAQLLPIRIPLTKGLIGWRLLLLKAGERERLRDVTTLQQLRLLRTAQVHDWPDMAILRGNGLTVAAVSHYDGLFSMLEVDRLDYVPRSLPEIGAEADSHRKLAIDPYLVLRYASADYFFVNRNNTRLAEIVSRGLEMALADGSFDQLFYAYYGKSLRDARLDKRRIIDLDNPSLPADAPLRRKELWFSMDDLKKLR